MPRYRKRPSNPDGVEISLGDEARIPAATFGPDGPGARMKKSGEDAAHPPEQWQGDKPSGALSVEQRVEKL